MVSIIPAIFSGGPEDNRCSFLQVLTECIQPGLESSHLIML